MARKPSSPLASEHQGVGTHGEDLGTSTPLSSACPGPACSPQCFPGIAIRPPQAGVMAAHLPRGCGTWGKHLLTQHTEAHQCSCEPIEERGPTQPSVCGHPSTSTARQPHSLCVLSPGRAKTWPSTHETLLTTHEDRGIHGDQRAAGAAARHPGQNVPDQVQGPLSSQVSAAALGSPQPPRPGAAQPPGAAEKGWSASRDAEPSF